MGNSDLEAIPEAVAPGVNLLCSGRPRDVVRIWVFRDGGACCGCPTTTGSAGLGGGYRSVPLEKAWSIAAGSFVPNGF